jgi:hypothetical protein
MAGFITKPVTNDITEYTRQREQQDPINEIEQCVFERRMEPRDNHTTHKQQGIAGEKKAYEQTRFGEDDKHDQI